MAEPGLAPPLRVERLVPEAWRTYRDVRMAALIDSPRAFWTTYAEAAARDDAAWEQYASTGPATWLAVDEGRPVGTVGLFAADDLDPGEVYLVGMWVAAPARGSGAAEQLVEAALAHAADAGFRRVVLDVARENARACRFYLRRGFALTGETGTMPWDPSCVEVRMARDLP